ncbi:hypothetical protein BZG25_08780 [Salinivibrio sp. ML198]|uniref:hypothetical protein n=1 Tax=Salinivibrio sp. ML198 TaxID=1909458 RepID=UPI0009CFDEAD|nr:hypothetical protein [Salinivibrio sp. ML198]OOE79651.1 hypothetical protein BZG25_08780 [Salinivibrio sp. ML198]
MSEVEKFHELAKDAGNRLRAHTLSVSSGATGVFFFALTSTQADSLSHLEKWMLATALVGFVLTVAICLYELRVDAQRFFALATELEKPQAERSWNNNENYKRKRYWLVHPSYITLTISIIVTCAYLILSIVSN